MPKAIDEIFELDAEGRFIDLQRAQQLREQLRLFAPGKVRVQIGPPPRSTEANAFYWSQVINPIWRARVESGQRVTTMEVHKGFTWRYLPVRVEKISEVERVLPPSTTKLDRTAFFYYVESIRLDEDVLALGVHIPIPEDKGWHSYSLEEPA